jgi:uncharacterized protein
VTGRTPAEPLRYNVAGLLSEPPGSVREYALAGITIQLGEGRRLADPIEGRLRLARTNRGILVRAALTTALEGECGRCLRPIEIPLSLGIDEEVLPSIDLASGLPVPTAAEPDVARLNDHHELDVEALVREAIDLAEPIAPVCRPDCPGLCSVCGLPLDDGPHDHDDEPIDPRLAALESFRVDEPPETG